MSCSTFRAAHFAVGNVLNYKGFDIKYMYLLHDKDNKMERHFSLCNY